MPIDNKLIDNLLKDYKTPEEILGEGGLLKQLTKAVLERAMQAELTEHSATNHTTRLAMSPATPETASLGRLSKVSSATCPSKSRATATPVSSHRSLPKGRPVFRASMTRYFLSLREA